MTQPLGYVDPDYLRAAARLLEPVKARALAWMHLQLGQVVLDVGCGPGTDTISFGSCVGPTGHVVGLDADPAMVATASQRAQDAEVAEWVAHQVGPATRLPFAADTFDAVHCERLFLHLADPAPVLTEMVRVTKPGGWIVAVETDHGAMSINSTETDIERRLVRALAEQGMQNGYAGRQLVGLFNGQHLRDLHIELFPVYLTDYPATRYITRLEQIEQNALAAGVITEAELERWHQSLDAAAAAEAFFASGSYVLCAARKPGVGERSRSSVTGGSEDATLPFFRVAL